MAFYLERCFKTNYLIYFKYYYVANNGTILRLSSLGLLMYSEKKFLFFYLPSDGVLLKEGVVVLGSVGTETDEAVVQSEQSTV